jgi:hypothetical protein
MFGQWGKYFYMNEEMVTRLSAEINDQCYIADSLVFSRLFQEFDFKWDDLIRGAYLDFPRLVISPLYDI